MFKGERGNHTPKTDQSIKPYTQSLTEEVQSYALVEKHPRVPAFLHFARVGLDAMWVVSAHAGKYTKYRVELIWQNRDNHPSNSSKNKER